MSNARKHWRLFALGIAVGLTAAVITFAVAARPGTVDRFGVAGPAAGAISVEADGRTYNIPLDVPWTDAQGTFHDAGRPDCLSPDAGNVSVRFKTADVEVEGSSWSQVVWVDCRSVAAR